MIRHLQHTTWSEAKGHAQELYHKGKKRAHQAAEATLELAHKNPFCHSILARLEKHRHSLREKISPHQKALATNLLGLGTNLPTIEQAKKWIVDNPIPSTVAGLVILGIVAWNISMLRAANESPDTIQRITDHEKIPQLNQGVKTRAINKIKKGGIEVRGITSTMTTESARFYIDSYLRPTTQRHNATYEIVNSLISEAPYPNTLTPQNALLIMALLAEVDEEKSYLRSGKTDEIIGKIKESVENLYSERCNQTETLQVISNLFS